MRRLAALAVAFTLAHPIFAQTYVAGGPGLVPVLSDPSGACITGQPNQINVTNGHQFYCNGSAFSLAGTWTQITTGGGGSAPAFTTVSFSATPAFSASSSGGDTFKITLTGNVTSSTLSGATTGEEVTFLIYQDGVGARTFVWPTTVVFPCTVSPTANSVTVLTGRFDGTNVVTASCANSNTGLTGPESTATTSTSGAFGALSFASGSHTAEYYANNSANRHLMPRTAGATDQLASTDLSDASSLRKVAICETGTATSTTASASETNLATCTIPANTIGANGRLVVWYIGKHTGSANTWTVSVRFSGTSGDTSGGIQIAGFANSAGSAAQSTFAQMYNANSTSAQVGISNLVGITTGTVNTTSNTFVNLNCSVANAGDTCSFVGYAVFVE